MACCGNTDFIKLAADSDSSAEGIGSKLPPSMLVLHIIQQDRQSVQIGPMQSHLRTPPSSPQVQGHVGAFTPVYVMDYIL